MRRIIFLLGIIILVILQACSTTDLLDPKTTTQPSSTKDVSGAYPAPETKETTPQAYPAPIDSNQVAPYPLPENIPSDIIPFTFEKPLLSGDKKVNGTGPAGVPIEVVDVTLMRKVLARGIIESDNTFSIDLNLSLEKGHRIGIALAELAGTEWDEEQFTSPFYNGNEAMNVPTVGFFFDTAMVK